MSALVRLLVVVAAGVGAWFGYDVYVSAQDATESGSSVEIPAPWDDRDIVVADATWDGPTRTTTVSADGSVAEIVDIDPTVDRSVVTTFDGAGEVALVTEIDADELFVRRPGESWMAAEDLAPGAAENGRAAAAAVHPRTLQDWVSPEVWPYTAIIDDVPGGTAANPTRVVTIRMKGGAFANADPSGAAQWRRNTGYPSVGGRVEIEVELDADGQIVGLTFLALDGISYRYESLDVAPAFEAPFVD